jgi:hypothetical protein
LSYTPRFELGSFDDPALDNAWRSGLIRMLCAPLILANRAWLRAHKGEWPGFYASGRIREYRFNRDHWRDIPTLLKYGEGDCKDFASARVAELIDGHDPRYPLGCRAGIEVETRRTQLETGEHVVMYHVMVRYPDGRIEDPSRMMGMK